MILDTNIVAENIDIYIKKEVEQNKDFYKNKYIAFLLFEENTDLKLYIKTLKEKAKSFLLDVRVLETINLKNHENIIEIIDKLNDDKNCIWILVQLNKHLKSNKWKILAHINPRKDIEWMWWVLLWLSQIETINFLHPTVRAIFEILNFYKTKVSWKNVCIFWKNDIIQKSLINECIKQQATIFSFNEFSNIEEVKKICKFSDIIISVSNLNSINQNFLSKNKTQFIIDINWWEKVWNLYSKDINKHIYTKIHSRIWNIIVSSMFANLVDLQKIL